MRKMVLAAVLVAVVLGAVEGGARILLRTLGGVDLDARMRSVAIAIAARDFGTRNVVEHQTRRGDRIAEALHPYLGYVLVPSEEETTKQDMAALGFPGGGRRRPLWALQLSRELS